MEIAYGMATVEDISQIFELSKSLVDAYEDLSTIDYPKVLRWMERKIQENISSYTVITLAGEKIGYYCLREESGKWELDDFYILPQYRSMGIGSKVLEHICKEIKGSIFLYVFTQNTGAINLYQRFGFRWAQTITPTRQIMERPG